MTKVSVSYEQVQTALKGWYSSLDAPDALFNELMLMRVRLHGSANGQQRRFVINQIIEGGIEQLGKRNQRSAIILQKRFQDNDTIAQVAVSLNLSDDQVNRRQKSAIDQLCETLDEQEAALRQTLAEEMLRSLPIANYKELFGLDDKIEAIAAQLCDPNTLPVVCVSGIGGIGKTSLADAVVRKIVPLFHFDKVLWLRVDPATISGRTVTAHQVLDVVMNELMKRLYPDLKEPHSREGRLQRIRRALEPVRHLIVIDNIETDADTSMLMQHLDSWAGRSKFLVTTRTRLQGETAVLAHDLTELSVSDATALVRQQATERKMFDFAADVDELIDDIYAVTGGNPLALRLVVSLVSYMSLTHVLANLQRGGKTKDIGKLYTRIYWQAWRTLKFAARELLQAMPLVGEDGGEIEQLQAFSELDDNAIWVAINDLIARSLIEVRGGYKERRYGVHRLTMTFLQTEIMDDEWVFEPVRSEV